MVKYCGKNKKKGFSIHLTGFENLIRYKTIAMLHFDNQTSEFL